MLMTSEALARVAHQKAHGTSLMHPWHYRVAGQNPPGRTAPSEFVCCSVAPMVPQTIKQHGGTPFCNEQTGEKHVLRPDHPLCEEEVLYSKER